MLFFYKGFREKFKMNWKSCTSVAFCILTLLSAGCGNKSNDSSSSATAASSSTSAGNLEKQKKDIQDILKEAMPIIKEIMPELNEITDINKFYDAYKQQALENEKFFLDDFEIISKDDNP
jgi:hypothetical protein